MTYELTAPFSGCELEALRAGDSVYLSGVIYAARDAAHRRGHILCRPVPGAARRDGRFRRAHHLRPHGLLRAGAV